MKHQSRMTLKFPEWMALFLSLLLFCSFGLSYPLQDELLTIDKRGGLAGAYFHSDKTPDLIEVYLIIKSGGFEEGDAPDGLAHYLEHLVWLSAFNPDGRGSTARHERAS